MVAACALPCFCVATAQHKLVGHISFLPSLAITAFCAQSFLFCSLPLGGFACRAWARACVVLFNILISSQRNRTVTRIGNAHSIYELGSFSVQAEAITLSSHKHETWRAMNSGRCSSCHPLYRKPLFGFFGAFFAFLWKTKWKKMYCVYAPGEYVCVDAFHECPTRRGIRRRSHSTKL